MAKYTRKTIYNNITTTTDLSKINKKNIELMEDFLAYKLSTDKSNETLKIYRNNLMIFWCWNLKYNDNKYFVDLMKRDISRFQSYCINEWQWSSARVRIVKSTLSSLGTYIENILDEEVENFKSIIKKIENPVNIPVREKTVLTEEQVDFLLDELLAVDKIQQACVVALSAFCGCRKAEIARFKTDYFNDSNLILDGALYKTPEKIKTKGRSNKFGKPLYKYTTIDFKPYLDLWLQRRKELGIDSEWLFVTLENGEYKQIKIATLNSYAKTCSDILKMPFYFHCMRHALCTKLVGKYNLPAKIVQEFFGWSNQDMIGVYDDTEAVDDFGKYFTKDGIVSAESKSLGDL